MGTQAAQALEPPTASAWPDGFDSAPSEAGRKIGRYRLIYPVGEGGMSVVYLARDEALERDVALKVMHRHLARDPEARARFAREARAVARLTHRNIPEIYDFSGMEASGGRDGPAFIVTELIDGPALSKLLREGPTMPPELGVMMALGVARALGEAHAQNIVHRDVKPENVLVGKDGVVKLTDFGIAQVKGLESMTMTGTLIGSPAHMAPEQIEHARDTDHRVDIWGFGTVLYMVATGGALPFEADNPHKLLKKIVEGHYQDPRRLSPHVDSALANIIARCLVVEREARYQKLAEVVTDLERWLATRGLGEPEAEIRAFMADPEVALGALTRRLATALMAAGDDALARGDRGVALEHFGRVLALAPDDEVALTRVRGLERSLARRRGLVRYGAWTVGALVVAGGVYLLAAPSAGNNEPKTAPPGQVMTLGRMALPAVAPTIAPVPVEPTPAAAPMTAGAVFGEALGFELVRAEGRLAQQRREVADGARPDRPRVPPHQEPAKVEPTREEAPVAVRLTAFPPAVKIKVGGRTLSPGEVLSLKPGRYQVTLTHPSCEGCADNIHALDVPAGERFEHHFRFERVEVDLAPASLFVACGEGGYVVDGGGHRFACNVKHELAVTSAEPRLITLTAFDADGGLIKRQQFTVSPRRPIEWRP